MYLESSPFWVVSVLVVLVAQACYAIVQKLGLEVLSEVEALEGRWVSQIARENHA